MNLMINFEKWGLLIVLLYCCGLFTPDFSPKIQLLELDLNSLSDTKSGSDFFKQIFWLLLAFIYTLIVYVNRSNADYIIVVKSMRTPLFFMIAILFICSLSVLWADYSALSIKRTAFQLILFWVLLQSFIFCYLRGKLVSTFKCLCYLIVLMVFISVITGSGINPYLELAGFAKSKNTMGAMLGVIFILSHLILSYYNVLIENKYLLFLVLLLLLLTFSKTSILLVFVYLFLSLLSTVKIRFFLMVSLFTIICLFIFTPIVTYLLGSIWHVGLIVPPEFMTGRGLIWDTIYYDLDYFNKMIFGYGYGSFFGTPSPPYFFDSQDSFLRYINSSHNGYIELLTQIGFFSIFVALIPLVVIYRSSYELIISAVSFPIFYNISEPAILRDQHIVWVMCLLLIFFPSVLKNEL